MYPLNCSTPTGPSMPRPFEIPDPADRSPNDPTKIVSSAAVLGLYKQENPDEDHRGKVTDPVKKWFKREMRRAGWTSATFHGSQCLLEATVVLKKPKLSMRTATEGDE